MSCVPAPIAGLAVALTLGLLAGPAAAAAPAPACVPSTLNNSGQLDGAVSVSPLPGSRDATPQTQVSFLGVPAGDLTAITVSGSRTGPHSGHLARYSQGDGESFLPDRPFAEGEAVTVQARLRTAGVVRRLREQFAIARQDALSSTPETIHAGGPADVQSFRSRPDLHPPVLTVSAHAGALAPGDEFAAPYDGPGQSGPMILDPNGDLVWFKGLPHGTSATNFQVQRYDRKPVLTWWQGDISVHGFGLGEDVIANSSYQEVGHVHAGNGLLADLHDFQLTPAGTALLTAYDPIYCDLAAEGGPSYGAVADGVMQEIDVKTGLVMFQWTSLDHVALSESYELARDSRVDKPFDFFHINSIDPLPDGSVLVSARNTWAVYDLDAATGQVAWRLGGKHSTFTMGPGTGTAWQHDPRVLADGTISIFDNGASPEIHRESRVAIVRLDQQRHTASLVSQLVRPTRVLADSQGNAQELPNGDWFVGWGQVPDFSELSPTGALLFDAHFPAGAQSYRDFRFAWTGTPAQPPSFAVVAHSDGATVYASWNGATQLAAWRVLAGSSPAGLHAVATAPRGGFETAIQVPAGVSGRFVTVQALDASGTVIATAPASRPSASASSARGADRRLRAG